MNVRNKYVFFRCKNNSIIVLCTVHFYKVSDIKISLLFIIHSFYIQKYASMCMQKLMGGGVE